MKDLLIDIQDDLERDLLTSREIAEKYGVPLEWVREAYIMLCQQSALELGMATVAREQ